MYKFNRLKSTSDFFFIYAFRLLFPGAIAYEGLGCVRVRNYVCVWKHKQRAYICLFRFVFVWTSALFFFCMRCSITMCVKMRIHTMRHIVILYIYRSWAPGLCVHEDHRVLEYGVQLRQLRIKCILFGMCTMYVLRTPLMHRTFKLRAHIVSILFLLLLIFIRCMVDW